MCNCYGTCWLCSGIKPEFLFKEKEQKVIKFEDVKVGDRVKLVHGNGDTAEVTVTDVVDNAIFSKTNGFLKGRNGWSVAEILEKPMPNKPGTILHWTGGKYENDKYVRLDDPKWVSLVTGETFSEETMKRLYNPKRVKVVYGPK